VRLSIIPIPHSAATLRSFKNANLNKTRPPLHSAGAESCRKRCRFLGHQSLVWCVSNDLAMLLIPPRRRNATKVGYAEGHILRQRQ
jgi:hypothetical protein